MSIGAIDSEQALANFVRQEIDRSSLGTLVRQLQGAVLRVPLTVSSRTVTVGTNVLPNSTRPTLVLATVGNGPGQADIFMDSSATPAQVIARAGAAADGSWHPVAFLVPAGWSYRIAVGAGAVSVDHVYEWTL